MKMVKKILLGLVTGALVLGFVGCKPPEGGDSDAITESSFWGKSADINKVNESADNVIRGFEMLNTKHLDAMLHITNTVNKIEKPANTLDKKTNGVMGYIFNYTTNDETQKSSFTVAGVRYNQFNGNVEAYVDTFSNIDNSKLSTEDFANGVKADGITYNGTTGFFTLVDKETVDAQLAANANKLELWIDVVANDEKSEGRTGAAGSYTVRFFGNDPQRDKKTNNGLVYKNEDRILLKEATVKAANVNNPFVKAGEEDGKLTNMQSYIGYYYNVARKNTLTGEWAFSAIKMEAEEIE